MMMDAAAMEPAAVTRRLKTKATGLRGATLPFREARAARAMVEAVAELANVPITLCNKPAPERFFKAFQKRGQPLPFSMVRGIRKFIEKSRRDPTRHHRLLHSGARYPAPVD